MITNATILVADNSEALLYTTENLRTKELQLVKEFKHPEGRKKVSELITDRAGKFQNDSGYGGSFGGSFEKDKHKMIEAEHFAKMLIDELHHYIECNPKNDGKLVIVALPHLHNLLIKHWHCHCITPLYVNKEYTKLSIKDLTIKLREHLLI